MKANTKKFQLFEFSAGMKLSEVNIEALLDCLAENFESSGNPVHAWMAIYWCDKFKKPLPSWVIAYLAQCSKRMFDTRETSDLQAVLAEVLGFPKRRPGPGKPLKLGPDLDKISFTTKFVNYILQGKDSKTAKADACNETFKRKIADKVDNKTLDNWLIDTMGLPEKPQDDMEWKTAALRYAALDLGQRTFWNAGATDADRDRARALANKAFGLLNK
jgi:hypothetical protein